MREQEREAPQLYGPQTEPASTSSSEIQAEVQRQLRQYVQRYEGVANSLRGQLEEVQRERDELLARQQHGVPTGDRAPLHAAWSTNRRSGTLAAWSTNRRSGTLAAWSTSRRSGTLAAWSTSRRSGTLAAWSTSRRSGTPAAWSTSRRSGTLAAWSTSRRSGTLAAWSASRRSDTPAAWSTSRRSGTDPSRVLSWVVKIKVGVKEPQSILRRGEKEIVGLQAQSAEPSQLDLLGVIAAGMKQLQEAQVRAYDKKANSMDPETVKPGVSVLPELKPPEPETSPVEVQDWLQLLQAPMADLSDSSHEWWHQVQEIAQRGYEQWASATPLERLSMKAPRDRELEEGKYARLNSRPASMLRAALDSSVRADLVLRRSTQSTSQILYRVLTLYQPGGENEKRLIFWTSCRSPRNRPNRLVPRRRYVTGRDGSGGQVTWE